MGSYLEIQMLGPKAFNPTIVTDECAFVKLQGVQEAGCIFVLILIKRDSDWLNQFSNYFNSFASQTSFIDRARSTAEKFHIFGSVHAMKTEIPPFDSEIKDLTNSSL